jgi:hypothetical protein
MRIPSAAYQSESYPDVILRSHDAAPTIVGSLHEPSPWQRNAKKRKKKKRRRQQRRKKMLLLMQVGPMTRLVSMSS